MQQDARLSGNEIPIDGLSPSEELRGFSVPDGFEVELVVAETGEFGKFVSLAFDSQGRLWTMTAMEYPVDANENPEASAKLFADGGRDKVLVVDRPFGKLASPPRVFAEGLVMPLGILPYRDGAFVQYGSEIRLYRDEDGDGRADRHETILQGFGTEDSHLFPHQFTRVPGGHVLMAQGLFNSSVVHRPGNVPFSNGATSVPFNHCKLAQFRLDGSLFEPLTAGPNNIWGLTISREGETWIQEANDLGFPIIPYEPGGYYPTGSAERLRPYQPLMPAPLGPAQMGGTGLSGLALADDADGWPAPWGARDSTPESARVFYLANPITSSIQVVHATRDGQRYRYTKQSDFLKSSDPRFRPVAIQFGPDGCLYVVDWYNKIISHNEVPRNHPERDKSSGRIWRIRHESQSSPNVPILAALSDNELLAHLGAPNARIADLAWQEIVDRPATSLVPRLEGIVLDRKLPAPRRLGALWSLEGLAMVPVPILSQIADDPNPNLRNEAVRIAAAQLPENDFLEIAEPLVDDPSPQVRAAVGDALRRVTFSSPRGAALMLKLGRERLSGNDWDSYDRDFERYLARWAMENNRPYVAKLLRSADGKKIPLENRVLATLSLDERTAATELAKLIPELRRPLGEEEIRVLIANLEVQEVNRALRQAAENPTSRVSTLRALLNLRTSVDPEKMSEVVSQSTSSLWDDDPSAEGRTLALETAGAFRLTALESRIVTFAADPATSRDMALSALRALREIGSADKSILALMGRAHVDKDVRSEALAVLAESGDEATSEALLERWDELNYEDRHSVLDRMAAHRAGAEAVLAAWEAGDIESSDIPIAGLEKMRELLPDNPAMRALWNDVADRLQRVLRLTGADDDAGETISLSGPFTVESWVQLVPDIGNADSLLGGAGALDINFHDGRIRVWVAGRQQDIAVAEISSLPDNWSHYAITRDAAGVFRIYINGELATESTETNTVDFPELRIGWSTTPSGGTDGRFAEYRIWNVARSATQIRDNFDRGFAGEALPNELVHRFAGADWGDLHGNAHVEATLEAPTLITASQSLEREEKFTRFRQLAGGNGNPSVGKSLFAKHCLTCHQQSGEGGKIGPALDGVGLTGTEALLRNILTPNAAMEGGYRNFRALTRDGRIVDGLLVSRDDEAIVLRQPNTADIRIGASDVARAEFTTMSVMPEGLLESLTPDEVTDLFAYLKSLRQ